MLVSLEGKQFSFDVKLCVTGLRAKKSDTSIFSTSLCNCWCTHWAEVHIRRPTGNLAWIMRIENEQDLTETFPDFSLADISNLFKSGGAGGSADSAKVRHNSAKGRHHSAKVNSTVTSWVCTIATK